MDWSKEIKELEFFFKTAVLPSSVKITSCETVMDPKMMIDAHLKTIKAQNGNETFLPYLHRLQAIKNGKKWE